MHHERTNYKLSMYIAIETNKELTPHYFNNKAPQPSHIAPSVYRQLFNTFAECLADHLERQRSIATRINLGELI